MRPRPCKQAGVPRTEALPLPGRRLPSAARGAAFVTYFRHYWACADTTGHAQIHLNMQMRYFAYDNQLQMVSVPCPIWFTDRQDSSANQETGWLNSTQLTEKLIVTPFECICVVTLQNKLHFKLSSGFFFRLCLGLFLSIFTTLIYFNRRHFIVFRFFKDSGRHFVQ